jgi:hypothetical protein
MTLCYSPDNTNTNYSVERYFLPWWYKTQLCYGDCKRFLGGKILCKQPPLCSINKTVHSKYCDF